ncbi:MAG TPA: DUF5317 family protein [Trebonia sp.]|nr:DUF5317 family protein [Trebonia sp.]
MAILLFAIPVAAGLCVGWATGGSLRNLVATRFLALWLIWAVVAAQLADVIPAARTWVFVATFAVAVGWLVVNALRWPPVLRYGALAVAAGGLLNGVAIAANGRMPYSTWAAVKAGVPVGHQTARNVAATHATRLLPIGDVIPAPFLHAVFSFGDILICLGIAVLVAAAMRARPLSSAAPAAAGPGRLPHGQGRAGVPRAVTGKQGWRQ